MKVHEEELSDVSRYLRDQGDLPLEDMEDSFRNYLRLITKYHPVDASTRMLEIGTGTGWFPVLCSKNGLRCKGLEISPALVECARKLGRRHGVEPDIELGNIEAANLEDDSYDVIIASSVFEHVEYWREGLGRVYSTLRPGGLLLFESTNKFSFTSGEYPMPFYGWLPDGWRYRLRIWRQGPDIMKLGIDFNQFRYGLLRSELKRIGFSEIHDLIDIASVGQIGSRLKRILARAAKKNGVVRSLTLAFADVTRFVCIK